MSVSNLRAFIPWWPALLFPALLVFMGCSSPYPGLTEATPAPIEQLSPPPIEQGAELYRANCQGCHGGPTGGQMMDVPPPHNANGHTWHHPDCQLKAIILDGSGEMGMMMRQMMDVPETAPRMPAFRGQLTQDEVAAILTYIKTWWTEEQRQFQARATQESC